MKKNLFFAMAGIAACCVFSSCNNENEIITPQNTLAATATIEGSDKTRTTYSDQGTGEALKVEWNANETYKAYYESGSYLIFDKTNGSNFIATDVPDGVDATTPFVGVYGDNVTDFNYATGKYTVDFADQDGTLENLAKYDAMTAISTTDAEGLHFHFEHKCAFLRVTLKRGTSDYLNSTEDGLKTVKLHFYKYKITDENMETTWPGNIAIHLDSPLEKGETRTVYIAIPPIKGDSNGPAKIDIQTDGYNKTVPMYTSGGGLGIGGGTPTIKEFQAGKVYETTINYSVPTTGEVW